MAAVLQRLSEDRMSPVQALREFIQQRLTAAAAEIFTAFLQTTVQFQQEIDRQRKLLQIHWKHPVQLLTAERPQQHMGKQKSSSSVEQEEHEAPHIKEQPVPDGGDHSHHSVRDWSSQRLTAAAEDIFTLFQQAVLQYEEEMAAQRRMLQINWNPHIQLHRAELQQDHDCREEQLFEQETHCSSIVLQLPFHLLATPARFCSMVKGRGTILAATRLKPKSS
ncbi:uncharacterized protein LOC115385022 [Salarias fasciatus]|uniref:uncharacterized protein LOC115385022 n=1 Tax=Salarias fasciatus TaxID=181472 RepID=UPI001176FE31|nr:uncharacterized protein LOC115385022 [Salarias fasciatus]